MDRVGLRMQQPPRARKLTPRKQFVPAREATVTDSLGAALRFLDYEFRTLTSTSRKWRLASRSCQSPTLAKAECGNTAKMRAPTSLAGSYDTSVWEPLTMPRTIPGFEPANTQWTAIIGSFRGVITSNGERPEEAKIDSSATPRGAEAVISDRPKSEILHQATYDVNVFVLSLKAILQGIADATKISDWLRFGSSVFLIKYERREFGLIKYLKVECSYKNKRRILETKTRIIKITRNTWKFRKERSESFVSSSLNIRRRWLSRLETQKVDVSSRRTSDQVNPSEHERFVLYYVTFMTQSTKELDHDRKWRLRRLFKKQVSCVGNKIPQMTTIGNEHFFSGHPVDGRVLNYHQLPFQIANSFQSHQVESVLGKEDAQRSFLKWKVENYSTNRLIVCRGNFMLCSTTVNIGRAKQQGFAQRARYWNREGQREEVESNRDVINPVKADRGKPRGQLPLRNYSLFAIIHGRVYPATQPRHANPIRWIKSIRSSSLILIWAKVNVEPQTDSKKSEQLPLGLSVRRIVLVYKSCSFLNNAIRVAALRFLDYEFRTLDQHKPQVAARLASRSCQSPTLKKAECGNTAKMRAPTSLSCYV
ncbi:hypothetical protein WN51_10215 [Melipona quadrifasciata]|uniref:Uncharacterized protein n=1 Tax=Melipona quadrifasciata TaxID=166423 RepID=A0A0M9A4L3_9HYME|nr:hypothetical protein WN51_10215 [Melipona quadrifasciata]